MFLPIKLEIMKLLTRLLLTGALLTVLAGCSSREPATTTANPADSTRPDTQVRGARIDLYDGKQVTTQIHADQVVRFEQIDSTMGYVVHTDFLDSTGNVTSKLDGDSALIRETTSHLYVFGHVVVVSQDHSRLETDYLHWNPDIKKIQTDAFVKVTRKGDVITGWGLEADQQLTRIKILKQVSGTIHNADELEDDIDTASTE